MKSKKKKPTKRRVGRRWTMYAGVADQSGIWVVRHHPASVRAAMASLFVSTEYRIVQVIVTEAKP